MVGTGRRGWHRHGVSRRAAAVLLVLALAAAAPAGGEELNLLATSSANQSGGTVGGQSTSQQSFTQSLDVNYNRSVTPLLGYRLRFRGSDNESTASTASTSVSTTNRFIEPEVDVTLAGAKYSLNGGARIRQTFVSGTQAEPLTLTENHQFLRAFFTPDLLPAFNFQVERTATGDDRTPATLDREDTRAILGASYTLAQKVNLAYTFTNQKTDDKVAKRTQEQRSHVATANYTDSFFDERLSVNGNYLLNRLDTTERSAVVAGAAGPLLLPIVLSGAFSLTESDPTVAAASKVPPAGYGTLTTGTGTVLGISVPLVVNDGGTPIRNQAIVFGLSAGASVTTIRLTVSPRAGDPRDIGLQVQGVSFQVFAATGAQINQTGWTLVPLVSVTPPSALALFFEITIGATGGSFLKVHVAGDTQQPPLGPLTATAIEALGPPAAGAAATRRVSTGNLLQSLTGGVMARPISDLTFNGNATLSINEQDPSGRRDTTGTYSATATGTPHRLLTATGLFQSSFTTSSDPQTPETATRIASLTLSSTPLPTLTASVSGTRSENDLGGVIQNRTDAVGFNTALKPYRNLNVDLTSTTSRAQNFVDGTETQGFSTALNANAALTARLTGLFGYTFSSSQVTGGVAPSSVTSNATFLSLTYTISRFLNANGRWDYSTSAGTYTLTQQYRLDVIPTLKTSILVTYLRTDQRAAGISGSTNTVTLTARWNVSRHLDLSATTNFTRGITGDTMYSIFSTLAFRL